MHNLFNQTDAENIISRMQKLQPGVLPLWGKMNTAQMLAHCKVPFDVYFGDKKMKQSLTGMLFGKMAKKGMLSDKPFPKNLPTAKQFVIVDNREFEQERINLIDSIRRFSSQNRDSVTTQKHPFFGNMTTDEWSLHFYKHLDHHLRQFGV